jgi:16S rRNA (uracil1498-N3)-methyltransferase
VSRFHVRPEAVRGDRVVFDRAETHHLVRVLRLGEGDVVQAVDGRGAEYTIRLTRLTGRQAEGALLGRVESRTDSPLELVLAQGVPKGDKLEGIIRMATELGVSRIDPLLTARSVAGGAPDRWAARVDRYRRVAREAAKQCGRGRVPDVATPVALADWIGQRREPGLLVCLWERERSPLPSLLPQAPVTRAALVIGPEGGLAEAEVEALRRAGALVASLGPRILRCETAGPTAVALLQARYGDLGARAAGQR